MLTYLSFIRVNQWIKNLLILFPPFFGGTLFSPDVFYNILPAILAFCFASSSNYIINDLKDIEVDKNHFTKKKRLLASGKISKNKALLLAIIFLMSSFLFAYFVSDMFWAYLLSYIIISFLYTFLVKNLVIIDIFFISFGFLVRVLAGGEAFAIEVSKWLFMTVFMVSLFLATGKRLGELMLLGQEAEKHRKSLALYSQSFLEGALWFSASSALVTYALYTLEQRSGLFYTVPLAAFGLFRYIFISKEGRGDPTDALLKDKQIMAVGIIWLTAICYSVY